MKHPVLTPCCSQKPGWDGEVWVCGVCQRKFIPQNPDFEKPFPIKQATTDDHPRSTMAHSVKAVLFYWAPVVAVF